jgi:hypothetical protein
MKTEIMDTTFGVVPSQDDLEWVWEDLQDGVLLQDLLLCSVLPSPQKPSAVFVEAHENVNNNNSGYVEEQEDEYMNEWYINSNNNLKQHQSQQQQHLSSNIVLPNEIQTSNTIPPSTYNGYNGYQYHQHQTTPYTHKVQNVTTMDYTSTSAAPAQNIPAQQLPFLPESEVAAFLNSNGPSTANNTEVAEQHQPESYRTAVSSVYSNSSWDSFADDSSHTTELSQEEIFEEIQRECAEIERKSMSPKLEKSSRSKKQSRASRKLNAEERKKELNRAAAAKYREKKRIEREGKMVELEKLEIRNRKLRSEANGLENEIKYLRELIKEIRTRREEQS